MTLTIRDTILNTQTFAHQSERPRKKKTFDYMQVATMISSSIVKVN